MICPKCGFDQPDDIYCVFCGVNIEKHLRQKKKRRYKGGVLAGLIGLAALSAAVYLTSSYKAEHPDEAIEDSESLVESSQEARSQSKSRQFATADRSKAKRQRRQQRESKSPTKSRKASIDEDQQVQDRQTGLKSPVEGDTQKGYSGEDVAGGPNTASQWFEKGMALDDDSDAEIECYQKAIALDAAFAPAHYRLGAIYYRQANYELADQEFASFVQHASEADREAYDIYIYYSYADVERLSGKPEEETAVEKSKEEETAPEKGEETVPSETEGETEQTRSEEPPQEASDEVMTIVDFSPVDGHIMVPVVLNDFFQAKVLVDTGAGITILSKELAHELGLAQQGGHAITLKTIGNDVQGQLAMLDSIQIGHLSRHNFHVAITDLPIGQKGKFDGILGMDFMKNYKIHIDNQEQRMVLTPRAQ